MLIDKTSQHSVHPTGGSLRVFGQFARLEVGPGKTALSRPAHQRVTLTVGLPYLIKYDPIFLSFALMENSVSPLYFLTFNAFFIVFLIVFYIIGVWQWKSRVTDDRARKAGPLYYALLVLTFGAGAFARTIQQLTGSEWADAFVPIFGGLFTLAMAWPLVFLPRRHPLPIRKQVLSWIVATLITLLAMLFFFVGFRQLLGILP